MTKAEYNKVERGSFNVNGIGLTAEISYMLYVVSYNKNGMVIAMTLKEQASYFLVDESTNGCRVRV